MMKSNFLEKIKHLTLQRLKEDKTSRTQLELAAQSARKPHCFLPQWLSKKDPCVIAEVKLASPSRGPFAVMTDPVAVAGQYVANGAKAISVLTEPYYFRGSLLYLQQIRTAHPDAHLLMKDFIVDEVQVLQARLSGADAVLLIVALLDGVQLTHLYHYAVDLGLTPLVEVHNEEELVRAESLGATHIGINNRNLHTLDESLLVSRNLITKATTNAFFIAESGIRTGQDVVDLAACGFHGFLIGGQFMQQANPGESLAHLLHEVVDAS